MFNKHYVLNAPLLTSHFRPSVCPSVTRIICE